MKNALTSFAFAASVTCAGSAPAKAPDQSQASGPSSTPAATAAPRPPTDALLVLAPLHGLHSREPGFTYADLTMDLDAAAPDILMVETRPDELAGLTDTPGRPEYPAVIWPWLQGRTLRVEAMEPGGEVFATMVRAASARYARFREEHPEGYAETDRLQAALILALLDHWRHPADAHDQRTRDLSRASVLVEQALGGPGADQGQAEWDGYMIDRVRAVLAANPGKRIVVLASYRNQGAFRAALQADPRWAEAEPWLRGLPVGDRPVARPTAKP